MIQIRCDRSDKVFQPGETISGAVEWSEIPPDAERVEIRLIWYTTGKGTQDVETIEKVEIASPPPTGRERFEFVAPHRPISFSGMLIQLTWAIEVICFPEKDAEQETIIISPVGREIVLEPLEKDKKRFGVRKR